MAIINQHEWVVELLRQARRREEEVTPESMEENLRWLMRIAAPEVPASAALRERVRALTMLRRFWQWGRPARGAAPPPAPPALPYQAPPGEIFTAREQQLLRLLLAVDRHRLPETEWLEAEAQAVMRQFLEHLPDLQREALLLQVRHALSLPEIAQILGLSEAQTGDLLRQARAIIFGQGFPPFTA